MREAEHVAPGTVNDLPQRPLLVVHARRSSPPDTATMRRPGEAQHGPHKGGISSAAAPSALPTSRFAAASENWSSAPDGGIPTL